MRKKTGELLQFSRQYSGLFEFYVKPEQLQLKRQLQTPEHVQKPLSALPNFMELGK